MAIESYSNRNNLELISKIRNIAIPEFHPVSPQQSTFEYSG